MAIIYTRLRVCHRSAKKGRIIRKLYRLVSTNRAPDARTQSPRAVANLAVQTNARSEARVSRTYEGASRATSHGVMYGLTSSMSAMRPVTV